MKFKKSTQLLSIPLLMLAVSCGGSSDSGTTSGTSENVKLAAAVGKVAQLTEGAGTIIGASSKIKSSVFKKNLVPADLASVWTTGDIQNPDNSGGVIDLQEWFELQFDPTFQNSNGANTNFIGRLNGGIQIFCYLAYGGLQTDETGLPATKTHNLTITTAMGTNCGGDTSSQDGQAVSIIVTEPLDTTYYDKIITVNLSECPFKFYARSNDESINLVSLEDQSCEGRDYASRTIVHYNKTTQIGRFEYISQGFTDEVGNGRGFEFYRGYIDENLSKAWIVGIYGGESDSDGSAPLDWTNYLAFTASGIMEGTSSNTTSVSVDVFGQFGGSPVANGVYEGCVNAVTNAYVSSSIASCSVPGTSIDGKVTSLIDAYKDNFTQIDDLYVITDVLEPSFTNETDLYTSTTL